MSICIWEPPSAKGLFHAYRCCIIQLKWLSLVAGWCMGDWLSKTNSFSQWIDMSSSSMVCFVCVFLKVFGKQWSFCDKNNQVSAALITRDSDSFVAGLDFLLALLAEWWLRWGALRKRKGKSFSLIDTGLSKILNDSSYASQALVIVTQRLWPTALWVELLSPLLFRTVEFEQL